MHSCILPPRTQCSTSLHPRPARLDRLRCATIHVINNRLHRIARSILLLQSMANNAMDIDRLTERRRVIAIARIVISRSRIECPWTIAFLRQLDQGYVLLQSQCVRIRSNRGNNGFSSGALRRERQDRFNFGIQSENSLCLREQSPIAKRRSNILPALPPAASPPRHARRLKRNSWHPPTPGRHLPLPP